MKTAMIKTGAGILLAGAALLVADAWFLSKYFFRVNRFRIGKENSRKRVKILLMTDLHFKKHFWPFHRRLARRINSLQPHLILCSGDLIDENGTPGPARQFLNQLNPSIPKLIIPGNHDHANSVSRHTLREIVERSNGRLLVNETLQTTVDGETFTITGLDDFIEGQSNVADAVKGVGKEQHHLLLVHSPLQQEETMKEIHSINLQRTTERQVTIQYVFAGHTHGGQVRWKSFIPVLPEKSGGYVNGWYNQEKPYLYVSKGFGTSHVPFRFGAWPEITLFEYGV